jgi:hypothetical protein
MGPRIARFVVPKVPPSQNETSGRRWPAVHALRQEFRALGRIAVAEALRHNEWDGRPFGRARLTLRFFWPRHANRRDPLNYAGSEGTKGLVDALCRSRRTELGAFPLVDDDWRRLEVVLVDGGVDVRRPRTELMLEELPSAEGDGGETVD